jgi:hypothetical protein
MICNQNIPSCTWLAAEFSQLHTGCNSENIIWGPAEVRTIIELLEDDLRCKLCVAPLVCSEVV